MPQIENEKIRHMGEKIFENHIFDKELCVQTLYKNSNNAMRKKNRNGEKI